MNVNALDFAMEAKCPMFHNRAISLLRNSLNAVYSFRQLVQATFSCPPAAISSHNCKISISQLHVSWKKQQADGYIYSMKFKRARKVHQKRKEQNSSRVRVGTTVGTILKCSSTEKSEGYGVTFTTSIKSGLLKALERQPIERIHSMQYDFQYLKQRAQNTGKESY